MAGELVYFELPVADGDRAQRFYAELFGWRFEPGNFPGYHMIPNAQPLAALAAGDPDAGHPRVFFDVADVEAARERVIALGGAAEEPVTVPAGTFARCRDDQGTRFTVWTGAER